MRLPVIAVCLLTAGCAKPHAWRYNAGVVETPWNTAKAFKVKQARATTMKDQACAYLGNEANLTWHGRTAVIRVPRGAPESAQIAVHSTEGSGGPKQVGGEILVRNWMDDFEANLQAQEKAGCLRREETLQLKRQIIDHASLNTRMGYRKIYGEYERLGYLDLVPGFRLRSVEPIREAGEVVGFLTCFYDLLPTGGGLRAQAAASEANVRGAITAGTAKDHPVLHLPPDATRLRLFFRSWNVSGHRRIALLAARTFEDLEAASQAFEANPEAFCAKPGSNCVAVPNDAVLGAEIRVETAKGPAYVPIAGNLSELLREQKVKKPEDALPSLKILRPFEGKMQPIVFDASKPGILGYIPVGGEKIIW